MKQKTLQTLNNLKNTNMIDINDAKEEAVSLACDKVIVRGEHIAETRYCPREYPELEVNYDIYLENIIKLINQLTDLSEHQIIKHLFEIEWLLTEDELYDLVEEEYILRQDV